MAARQGQQSNSSRAGDGMLLLAVADGLTAVNKPRACSQSQWPDPGQHIPRPVRQAQMSTLHYKLVHLCPTITSTRQDILSAELRVVEKLCTIRYIQDKEKIDVISYQDILDDLIRAMSQQTVSMALLKLWSHSSCIS